MLQPEAVAQRCSVKAVFLDISQNSQENTCVRVSFFKVTGLFFKVTGLWHRCFPVNSAKFLRTPFRTAHLWWLLLYSNCHCQGVCRNNTILKFYIKIKLQKLFWCHFPKIQKVQKATINKNMLQNNIHNKIKINVVSYFHWLAITLYDKDFPYSRDILIFDHSTL